MGVGGVKSVKESSQKRRAIPVAVTEQPPEAKKPKAAPKISPSAAKQKRERLLGAIELEDKIQFALHAGVVSDAEHLTLRAGKNKLLVEEVFQRALAVTTDLVKLDFAGARDGMVKVRKVDRRIRDLEPELRAVHAEELFRDALQKAASDLRLQKDPQSRALRTLEVVKRFAKALERNSLTFLEVRQPSVFIFNSGKITISSYRAVERKYGKEKQEPEVPLPELETIDVQSVDQLPQLLATAVPVIVVAEESAQSKAA